MIYAGIGSRETPPSIADVMRKFAFHVASQGFILRSGGAQGADSAFERGAAQANGTMEIYVPWIKFNNSSSHLCTVTNDAIKMAQNFHPNWSALSPAAQKLMARNCYQILGKDLKTPCDFVVCWTKDGYNLGMERTRESGGTGQAIEIALCNNIKVYNIKKSSDLRDLRDRFTITNLESKTSTS